MFGHFEDSLKGLRELPELEPSPALKQRTLAAMREASAVRPKSFRWGSLAKAAALVAAAGVGSLIAVWDGGEDGSPGIGPATAQASEVYFELAEESARLDELLMLLPESRRVMRADTASTIVGLENQVALIDVALSQPVDEAVAPQYREALMRDRVEVMNALVNVRYSQSRAFIF